MKSFLWAIVPIAAAMAIVGAVDRASATAAGSCEGLASLTLPAARITTADVVEARYCRVAATLTPSSDSDIKIEVWMPVTNWNRKFQAVGNGAFNGTINKSAMAAALGGGYATASTDTGHVGGSASFALGHPEKAIDFGWRAVHELTVASKKIVAAYYEASPAFSYWNGCSAGGRQAMKEAQRFPADFDGIVAGAPGLDWTGRAAQAVRVAQALQKNPAARLSRAKAQLLHEAVLAACDSLDGVRDGVLEDPKRCTFDPEVLRCHSADDTSCLTAAQVSTVKMMYGGRINPKTRREITGLEPGSELGWTDMGWSESARATGLEQFRFLVFKDPTWDIDAFTFDADIARAEDADHDTINALDPNLAAFIGRGGKLIQYHGWSDPQISPGNSTQYYRRVVEALGGVGRVHDAYRLFMAPGMGHCSNGEGPSSFDKIGPLEEWVERGKAPDRIIASRVTNGKADRTRPLCPYPQVAEYTGGGSTDDAANFVCKAR